MKKIKEDDAKAVRTVRQQTELNELNAGNQSDIIIIMLILPNIFSLGQKDSKQYRKAGQSSVGGRTSKQLIGF